jgi:signal peptidase II
MISAVIVVIILAVDQLTKFIVSQALNVNETIPLAKGIFDITLVHNKGAAFGILKNQTYLFIGASLVAISLIYSSLRKSVNDKYQIFSLSLILGGAVGNLIDRLRLGYVIDFFNLYWWPVFNVADSAITVGGILLAYSIIKRKA